MKQNITCENTIIIMPIVHPLTNTKLLAVNVKLTWTHAQAIPTSHYQDFYGIYTNVN